MKEKITTVAGIVEKYGIGKTSIVKPTLAEKIEKGEFNRKEIALLENLQSAVKKSKSSMYEVMYYCGVLSQSKKTLKKLGYEQNEFGKFCADMFGFDKTKASKYAKVGRLFIVQNGTDHISNPEEIHSVFAVLDNMDNYEDFTPTQLVEMLLPDDILNKGIDPITFWNSAIEKYGFDNMKIAVIRSTIGLLKEFMAELPSNANTSNLLEIEMKVAEMKEENADDAKTQPTENADDAKTQPTENADDAKTQPNETNNFEMPENEFSYAEIALLIAENSRGKFDDEILADMKTFVENLPDNVREQLKKCF